MKKYFVLLCYCWWYSISTCLLTVLLPLCVGVVYNYTWGGVRRDHTGWERCVSVPLVRPDMFHLLAQWDQYLVRFSDGPMWDPAWHRYTWPPSCLSLLPPALTPISLSVTCLSLRFDEDHHNCFSFCLGFINGVLAVEGRTPLSRETFTHTFILPRMRRVSKYTTLYQHVQRHQFYVVDRQGDAQEDSPVKPGLFQETGPWSIQSPVSQKNRSWVFWSSDQCRQFSPEQTWAHTVWTRCPAEFSSSNWSCGLRLVLKLKLNPPPFFSSFSCSL